MLVGATSGAGWPVCWPAGKRVCRRNAEDARCGNKPSNPPSSAVESVSIRVHQWFCSHGDGFVHRPPSAPRPWPHSSFPCPFPRLLKKYILYSHKNVVMCHVRRSRPCSLTFCAGKGGKGDPPSPKLPTDLPTKAKMPSPCPLPSDGRGWPSGRLRVILAHKRREGIVARQEAKVEKIHFAALFP